MHYKWVMMFIAEYSMHDFIQTIHGTIFANFYYIAMGANIGINSCMLGTCIMEADLITVENQVSIGRGVVLAAHSIENMLLKLAPARYLLGSTVRSMSHIFLGSTMEPRSTLLENSVVLKGETIPEGECWSGLPAGPVVSEPSNTGSNICTNGKKDQDMFFKKIEQKQSIIRLKPKGE